jgi:diguanylate cyclase (GGDEF)-like protein
MNARIGLIRSRRYKRPFSIVFLDCDNFKAINDRLGHHGGDSVLRLVAKLLKKECRSTDIVARLGGDEFVYFLMRDRP